MAASGARVGASVPNRLEGGTRGVQGEGLIWIDGDVEEDRRRQVEEKAGGGIDDDMVEERRRRVERQGRWLRARRGSWGTGDRGRGAAARGDRGEGERGLGFVWRLGWEWGETWVIGCGRAELIGKNHLHLQTGNPANQRAARAHQSLDNENDHEVKIDFNGAEAR